jgi:hypothetical protein
LVAACALARLGGFIEPLFNHDTSATHAGIGRITSRLPKAFADEVVESVLMVRVWAGE